MQGLRLLIANSADENLTLKCQNILYRIKTTKFMEIVSESNPTLKAAPHTHKSLIISIKSAKTNTISIMFLSSLICGRRKVVLIYLLMPRATVLSVMNRKLMDSETCSAISPMANMRTEKL